MPAIPPRLPSEVLPRVLRLARFDGTSVLALAGFFALVSGAAGDVAGAVFGILVAAAGAIELHGVGLIRAYDRRGTTWLIASQLYLMAMIQGYLVHRLMNLAHDPIIAFMAKALNTPDARAAGLDYEEFMKDFPMELRFLYLAAAALTLLYQGGMAVYYTRRRKAVASALDEAAAS